MQVVVGLETVAIYSRNCLESAGSPSPCVEADTWHIRAGMYSWTGRRRLPCSMIHRWYACYLQQVIVWGPHLTGAAGTAGHTGTVCGQHLGIAYKRWIPVHVLDPGWSLPAILGGECSMEGWCLLLFVGERLGHSPSNLVHRGEGPLIISRAYAS